MKIKLTLQRPGAATDLIATVDVSAKIGDLAGHLVRADPGNRGSDAGGPVRGDGATLRITGAESIVLDPEISVGDSGLRSGMAVAVVAGEAPQGARATAAVITAVSGPDTGREFALPRGSNIIGRGRECAVRLGDRMVSRQHARLNVSDFAEVIDLGSVNGVQIGDNPVTRAILRPGDRFRVGDTELLVRVVPPPGPGLEGAVEGFNRSPRLDPAYAGATFAAPEPPRPGTKQRFPLIPLMAPLLLGALLYFTTHNLASLVFVAVSPLLMVGYAVETRLAERSADRQAVKQFRDDIEGLVGDLRAEAVHEVAARNATHPPVAACVDAIRHGTPLLWTRRPADAGFAQVRLGTGRQPSRTTVEMPVERGAARELVAELTARIEPYASVDGVPVVAVPAEQGAIGVAGRRETALGVARALVTQIAALHSPAELVLAGFASRQSADDWDWLKWLPHTTSPHSPIPQRLLASNTGDGNKLVSGLEDLLARRAAKDAEPLPVVFVVVEGDTGVERSRLVGLAEKGWEHGIYVLWLASDTALLPAACRVYVSAGPAGPAGTAGSVAVGAAGFVHDGSDVDPITIETVDAGTAADLARRLAPLVDTGARVEDDSDLPRAVSLMTVTDEPMVAEADAIIERWVESRSLNSGGFAAQPPSGKPGSLRAVLGTSAAGAHVLDLRVDGPHALVGGTTGAGKSELLQSWLLALATTYSPERLTFLLVDYKGGSAFRELNRLPHTVGMVTDLDGHLVHRALASLGAELRYRERVLAEYRVKDLIDLEKLDITVAPPNLVIVVDEFAALVKELPEFVDGMINVAQRGRSLGVHLILATQRPAGVIKDNLRANTNLRIALRVSDEADSLDVLGSKQAAYFDSSIPGRAVSKTGPGRLVPFQTAYAGGWTTGEPPAPDILVEELTFGSGRVWDVDAAPAPIKPGPTDIQRLVQAMERASWKAALPAPRRPWLPALQSIYDLSDPAHVRLSRTDADLTFAIRDDPDDQRQPPIAFHPDTDGNLAVFGTGGAGKSTVLRTLAVVAGSAVPGQPVHVYGIDFGARGLAMLEMLPHVGSVIMGNDHERISRLFTWLSELVATRAERYATAGAGTITEYRQKTSAADEPRIMVLLDGVAAFRNGYEVGEYSRFFDLFCAIATDGRPVGVHVIVTADRPGSMPSQLSAAIQKRVVLRMADVNDYTILNVPADVLKPSSPPGRGLLEGKEIQVLTLGADPGVGSQTTNIRDFAGTMRQAGVAPAPKIARLPEYVPMAGLPAHLGERPVLGLASATLAPFTFDPHGTFLIAGPPGSGRTSALHAVAESIHRWNADIPLYYIGARNGPLAGLPLWSGRAGDPAEAAELATTLIGDLATAGPDKPIAVFVDSVSQFFNSAADVPLTDLVKACVTAGCLFVSECETTTLNSAMHMYLREQIKFSRKGLALAPDSNDGQVFRTSFPAKLRRADFPPGRALFIQAGRTGLVQVGLPAEPAGE